MHTRDGRIALASLYLDAPEDNPEGQLDPFGRNHLESLAGARCLERGNVHAAAATDTFRKRGLPRKLFFQFGLDQFLPTAEIPDAVAGGGTGKTRREGTTDPLERLPAGDLAEGHDVP